MNPWDQRYGQDGFYYGTEPNDYLREKAGLLKKGSRVLCLAEFEIRPSDWDVIVSIWCHLPRPLRRAVHQKCVNGLRLGGVFLLEAYIPRQLDYKTGGPPTPDLMMNLSDLRLELSGLQIEHGIETDRVISEGRGHSGKSAVVQVVARKV